MSGDPDWLSVTGLFHFDGASTWQNDSSDLANHINNVTGSMARIAGGHGGAFADAAGRTGTTLSSRAEAPHISGYIFTGDFTVEGWAYHNNSSGTQGIIGKGGNTGSARSWVIYWNGATITAEISTTGAASALTLAGSASSDDVWHHVCLERKGTKVRLYFDGVMVASGTMGTALFDNNTTPLVFGAINGTNNMLDNRVDDWRITQGLARYDSDSGFAVPTDPYPDGLPPVEIAPQRISQHVQLVLAETLANPRVSQHVMLAMVEMEAHPRISQHVQLVLCEYQPCHTRRAQLWKITRRDGVVLAFTSHDRPIPYGAHTYSPCDSLNPSASQNTADMEGSSNIELSGIISDTGIKREDIDAGMFDDAYVEVYLVSWGSIADDYISADTVRRLAAGWIGEISEGERGVTMEVLGPGQRLAQKSIVEVYGPGCRFEFGDPDTCGVDVDSMALPGDVTGVTDNGQFTGQLSASTSGAQYDQGVVRWLTGPNAGVDSEVKTVEFGLGDVVDVVLWAPAPFLPGVGDTFELRPGCDRLAQTCSGTYNNKPNFGGFDFVPGNDAISRTPDAKN